MIMSLLVGLVNLVKLLFAFSDLMFYFLCKLLDEFNRYILTQ